MPAARCHPAVISLKDRWTSRRAFTVLDIAFGDGARFLAVADALLDTEGGPACLHYVTVCRGVDLPALALAARATGEPGSGMAALAMQLQREWLPEVPGFQRLVLAGGRLIFTVVSDGLASALPQLDLAFDAAYCERATVTAFAVRWLARLAARDALLVIDNIDGLADERPAAIAPREAGAETENTASGNGTLLAALHHAGFAAQPLADGCFSFIFAPRHYAPPIRDGAAVPATRAIVIGAGLAGAAACHRLSARGWDCTLIEQHAGPAQQASGNVAGIFMPVLSRDDNPLSRLTRSAFLFALHVWESMGGVGQTLPGQRCGVLQMPRSDASLPSLSGTLSGEDMPWAYPPEYCRYMPASEASLALQRPSGDGWWFPAGGWLNPSGVCEAMLRACGNRLRILYSRQAIRLRRDDGVWHVDGADGKTIASAPVLILANGSQATQFDAAAHLPLAAIRGQVTHLPAGVADVPFVICGDAYLTPVSHDYSHARDLSRDFNSGQGGRQAMQGIASLGATYDNDAETAVRLSSHAQNIERLQRMLPGWAPPPDLAALAGRVGFRCVAPDRLPLAGALPDPAQLVGSGDVRLAAMPRLPGLYGLLGYGSRGLIWAPLAAELLAAQLNGEPAPLPRDLIGLLDPARFALKQRRQGG